jgi:low molecular weight protein-tyrosine phosphatase
MASILVVCTGNICRSPLAEGLLRQALDLRFPSGGPTVASAGTSGWEGSPAHPDTVRAALERDVDLSGFLARRLVRDHLEEADLILAMAVEHRSAMRQVFPEGAPRTFTLKELVRLLEALYPAPPAEAFDPDDLRRRVAEADALRRSIGPVQPLDEDVVDPLGLSLETFRAVGWELAEWSNRLVAGLFGKVPARTSIRDGDE